MKVQSFVKVFVYLIIAAIAIGIYNFIVFILGVSDEVTGFNKKNIYESVDNIDNINIDLSKGNIVLREDTSFRVYANSKNVKAYKKNNTLYIKSIKNNTSFLKDDLISIKIPKGKTFNNVNLKLGEGRTSILNLKTNNSNISIGTGNFYGTNFVVQNNVNITGGIGNVDYFASELNNLNLKMGSGSFVFTGNIYGNNKILGGLGEVRLNLDNLDSFAFNLDKKGLGSVFINDKIIIESTYGTGSNIINYIGGSGNLYVIGKAHDDNIIENNL